MRRLAIAVLAIGAIVAAFSGSSEIGFSVEVANGFAHVSAGSGVLALVSSAVILMIYLAGMEPETSDAPGRHQASASRRAVAWFLDFFLSLIAVAAVVALLPLTIEALATGHFQWAFERDTIS